MEIDGDKEKAVKSGDLTDKAEFCFPHQGGEHKFLHPSFDSIKLDFIHQLPPLSHGKMPPSQLKQLKASLRDNGVIRQQQSKKSRRQDEKDGGTKARQSRTQRNAALAKIREQFNPFEIKAPSRNAKFDVTTRDGSSKAGNYARPGVTKSLGEERVSHLLGRKLHSVGGKTNESI